MMREDRTFHLGGATLYVGGGEIGEKELESAAHYAGPTDGGIDVSFGADVYEIRDEAGDVKETVRRNEGVSVKGRLTAFQARTLALLTGCPYTEDEKGTTVYLGGRTAGSGRGISLLFVCPVGKGEVFRLHLGGRVESGASFSVSKEKPGRLAFQLSARGKGRGTITFREVAQ